MRWPGLASSIDDEASDQGRREDEGAMVLHFIVARRGGNSYQDRPAACGGGDKELAVAWARRSG
jgi:hypothetical protein